MVLVSVGLVVLVAIETSEEGVVRWVGMARLAGLPLTLVLPGVDGEEVSVVIELGSVPCRDLMAGNAGRGIPRSGMLSLEVAQVAGQAVLRIGGRKECLHSGQDMAACALKEVVVPDQPEATA